MKFTRLSHSILSRAQLGQMDQSMTDSEVLMNHAETMWEAEVHNFQRYEARGKLVVGATTGLLGFVSAVAVIAEPGESLIKMKTGPDFYISLGLFIVGFVCIVWGFNVLIQSARVFVAHSEEDAGSLPNPNRFAENGAMWWVSQPTLDSVEEIYLLAIVIRRLAWKTRSGAIHNKLRMRFNRMWAGRRILKERDSLFLLFKEHSGLREACLKKYSKNFSYRQDSTDPTGSYTYRPMRDRGPRDLASLAITVYILEHLIENDRMDAGLVIDDVIDKFSKFREEIRELEKFSSRNITSEYLHNHSLIFKQCIFHKGPVVERENFQEGVIDLLHPPIMVRSSSYYLQLAEAFCWKFCGRSQHPSSKDNPTGSERRFSELEVKSMASRVFNELQWKVFTSKYFAAQNLRSVNWNLWFRVKRSERELMKSFRSLFFAFIFVSLGEASTKIQIYNRFMGGFESQNSSINDSDTIYPRSEKNIKHSGPAV